MEWLSVIWIPLIGFFLWKFSDVPLWKTLLIPLAPMIILIPSCQYYSYAVLTLKEERHGGWTTKIEHYEAWNEYIHQTCTREVGSDKNKRTEVYDCSYVEYHPEYWTLHDSNGHEHLISSKDYDSIVYRFGKSQKWTNMHRRYHTINGNRYHVDAPITWEDQMLPVTTSHRYRNPVAISTSTFNFPKVSKDDIKKYGLHEYPHCFLIGDETVLGECTHREQCRWRYHNAKLGASKQIRLWCLIFVDKDRSSAFMQKSLWIGGNKNEFVLCVGKNDGKISWIEHFCWSPDGYTGNDEIGLTIRDEFEGKDIDLELISDRVADLVREKWQRKSFSEFNYIRIDVPWHLQLLIHIIAIISTILSAINWK